MVDLLEYQAKQLFKQVGIPTLPSQVITEPRQLRQLEIPYPIVVKSQVKAGNRGRAGGVRFAENTIDAIAAASIIFNLPILGQFPEVVLAEARYNAQTELFLAIAIDYQHQCPVLLGSNQGGVDLDLLFENLQVVAIEGEFYPYYGRKLSRQMGLTGNLIESVSEIIAKMYNLFWSQDLDLIEINPLGINATGELMALDGRISANNYGRARHLELKNLTESESESLLWIGSKPPRAKIGIICNSVEVGMATLDLLSGTNLAVGCVVVRDNPENFVKELQKALEEWQKIPGVQVILLNIIKSSEYSKLTVGVIADYLASSLRPKPASEERKGRETGIINRQKAPIKPVSKPLSFVLRLLTDELESLQKSLASFPVYWAQDLENAVMQTISLAEDSTDELANVR
ncbi:ATP-grasp domain-containing protein [Gloeocapsa sp. PCC 73106]|uniref:ATP-grasp domain-containing protein n=1 Tax=Gloeocapsa sp. PCC 73106 TaxID=102232 RepID=UPI0002ABC17A|nr:ATP-grasp domain-containing protein [Gloeocapsa sp. PCC 73106]ELR99635.1 succinyl-CoA synthetase, beta subunit [Gloeocapsa sp. PCC 73106]